ncbi:hypothetical protein [Streptomyces sp. NPDC060001]|uniref:hypothetical protein n=1 Tax=Streptomyces sp. NPDC060001 TaxID=3347032 RepID=UPI00369AC699
MADTSFDDLITLECDAMAAYEAVKDEPYSAEAWKPWLEAAGAFQAAVTKYAAQEGKDRMSVEMDVKQKVRHPEPESDSTPL